MPERLKKKVKKWSKNTLESFMRLETYKKETSTVRHYIPIDELCEELNTDPVTGLSNDQVYIKFRKQGPNAFTPSKTTQKRCRVFIATQFRGFSKMTIVASILILVCAYLNMLDGEDISSIIDQFVLGGGLLLIEIVANTIEYFMDRTNDAFIEKYNSILPNQATVVRNGITSEVPVRDLVEGDLISLEMGDFVPADLRIIESNGLKVDNFPVNGSLDPQNLTSTPTDEDHVESHNVAFFTTNIVEGSGTGIVIACGDRTLIGQIAGLTARLKPSKSLLSKDIDDFVKIIIYWSLFLGALFGIILFMQSHNTIYNILIFFSNIIISNVPEGFLQTCKFALIISGRKLRRMHCRMKNWETIINLGATSVICTNKTGTLTANCMKVCYLWYNAKTIDANSDEKPIPDKGFCTLMRAAVLCNRSRRMSVHSSLMSTEDAVLSYSNHINLYDDTFRFANPKIIGMPFNAEKKIQVNVHRLENGRAIVLMKGAPEIILERCSTILWYDQTQYLSSKLEWKCLEAAMQLAEVNEQVFAYCDLELDEQIYTRFYRFTNRPPNFPTNDMRFLGLISLTDPVREGVCDAIAECKLAGIKVTLISADDMLSARTIARNVGLINQTDYTMCTTIDKFRQFNPELNTSIIVHGSVLNDIQSEELLNFLIHCNEVVFACITPTQKLKIVECYQQMGEIVAVTGENVNDAPSLKKANIGISMGIVGSDVTQKAADMVLMNDNFSTIVDCIKEGRKSFDNLKKSVTFKLTSNMAQIAATLFGEFFGLPEPLNVYAFLFIDVLTDVLPSISLIFEKEENDILRRPPRNPVRDRLISRKLYFLAYGHLGLIQTLGGFFVYFSIMAEHGFLPLDLFGIREKWLSKSELITDARGQVWSYDERRVLERISSTGFMVAIVVMQCANVIGCKTRLLSIKQQKMTNWVLNFSFFLNIIITGLTVYSPIGKLIRMEPLQPRWKVEKDTN